MSANAVSGSAMQYKKMIDGRLLGIRILILFYVA